MIELTEEQRQALEGQPGQLLRLTDPRTQRVYVLLSAEIFDRFQELMEEQEDQAVHQAWLDLATRARRKWVEENP